MEECQRSTAGPTRLRTTLYVPGDRPDRFDKAVAAGADAIVIDLEDAVAERDKADARRSAATWLAEHQDVPAWVRVNNRPDLLADDLAMAIELAPLGVMMPKAEPGVCDIAGADVLALVETARGVMALAELASIDAVRRLAVGEADLAAELGLDPSPDARELWAIRSRLVVASSACGLEAPTGPVFTNLDDHDGLRDSSEHLRRQGFSGRSAIHPAQVPVIHAVFTPSAEEIARAQTIIDAYDSDGAGVVDGEFVDAAVVRQARNVLARGAGS